MVNRLRLTPSPSSVGDARRFCREWLDTEGCSGSHEVVALLVSELVTNVVLHARTACELEVSRAGSRIRVSVTDEDERLPVRKDLDPEAGSGRGLVLLHAMSTTTGVDLVPGGKQVWFEVDCRPS